MDIERELFFAEARLLTAAEAHRGVARPGREPAIATAEEDELFSAQDEHMRLVAADGSGQ